MIDSKANNQVLVPLVNHTHYTWSTVLPAVYLFAPLQVQQKKKERKKETGDLNYLQWGSMFQGKKLRESYINRRTSYNLHFRTAEAAKC
jgi:hypothetical protein